MPEDYVAKAGDCLTSIAFEHGFDWKTLWNHPNNAKLRDARKDPNVLLAGDVVHIPERNPKQLTLATGQRHKIVVPRATTLRLRIVEPQAPSPSAGAQGGPSPIPGDPGKDVATEDPPYDPVQMNLEARANVPYELVIDGKEISGSTDSDGQIVQPIAPNAKRAKLILEPDTPNQRTIDIKLGHLDPPDTVAGAKQRLANLGYESGDRGDEVTPDFSYVLTTFQVHQGLSDTGELDDAIRQKLNDLHGT